MPDSFLAECLMYQRHDMSPSGLYRIWPDEGGFRFVVNDGRGPGRSAWIPAEDLDKMFRRMD